MSQNKLVPRKEVLKVLKIHPLTLSKIVERKEMKVIRVGRIYLYDLDGYLKDNNIKNNIVRRKICYCRVSSNKQKEDLERQIDVMKKKYPEYTILNDIGSGLNYNRKNFMKIIKYAINGELDELVVTYKDRLVRFGFELIEFLIKTYSNGKIKILKKKEEETPLQEISQDILSIMNVYVAKINGLRKYKKKIKNYLYEEKNE